MRNLILKLTHRLWNREINRILCREYQKGLIGSRELHVLLSRFDPTQAAHCKVGRDY